MNTSEITHLVTTIIRKSMFGDYIGAHDAVAPLLRLPADEIHKLRIDWMSWSNCYMNRIENENRRKRPDQVAIKVYTAKVTAYQNLLKWVMLA